MLYFIFCKDDIVITAAGRIPSGGDCPIHLEPWNTVHNLPDLNGEPCCCVSIDNPIVAGLRPNSAIDENSQTGSAPSLRQIGLRASFDVLPPEEYQMAGKAREILYWDANTQYCGVCGSPMKKDSDISKKCTCCGKQVWPALATAIIVLIRRRGEDTLPIAESLENRKRIDRDNPVSVSAHEEVLMVRAHNFRGNHYGLVAGFVETGESLEECLEREVMEEVGLRVKNIRYRGSQPWPYPCGLMVGYMADYAGGEIRLQKSELSHGGWFTRDNLPVIPGKASLARRLIDLWLEESAE